MTLFGTKLGEYARFARVGIFLILLVGLARFIVGVSGVPYERATHLVSLTITTLVLAIVYGARAAATRFGGYRQLLPTVVLLALAMYGFIIAAILVEGLGGIHGYFHAPGHGLVPGHGGEDDSLPPDRLPAASASLAGGEGLGPLGGVLT